MQIRTLLSILILAAPIARAATFNLPKDVPQFSITLPDKWVTEEKGGVITSRPAKDSKVNISVWLSPAGRSLEEAFNSVEKELRTRYQEFNPGKASQEKQAGMTVLNAGATGKRDGVEFRVAVFALTPDGERFFGLSYECDEASGKLYGDDIGRMLDSIKSLKEDARKAKEKHDQEESAVPFPKDKPAFTMAVPNGFATDATPERLIIKPKKEHKLFFQVGAVPASDGVVDEATAKAWLPKKAQALLKALGAEDATSFRGVQDYGPPIAGHKAFDVQYSSDAVEELQLWLFTADGKVYFYAYFQQKAEDYEEKFEDDYPLGWQSRLVMSIRAAK